MKSGNFELIEAESVGYRDILTVRYVPSFFGRLLGKRSRVLRFIGSCTVWLTYPNYNEVNVFMEGHLYNLWRYEY